MNAVRLFKIFIVLSVPVTIVGALFKLMHWPGGARLLSVGLLCSAGYILTALYLIFKSGKPSIEKIAWLIAFVFFSLIAGIVFYIFEIPKLTKTNASGKRPVTP